MLLFMVSSDLNHDLLFHITQNGYTYYGSVTQSAHSALFGRNSIFVWGRNYILVTTDSATKQK